MKKIQVKNIIWKEGKYYVVQCLNVDVSSFGETKKEALKNIEEALGLYFEDNDDTFVKVEKPELITSSLKYA
jgi:predicted RNase H-like HicB family nuclease